MVVCPSCGTEVQPDWDWCHACGLDPDAQLPVAAPTVHPEVLRSELVPVGDRPAAAPGAPRTRATARPAPPRGGSGPNRTVLVAAIAGGVAVVVAILLLVALGGSDPTPVVDADVTKASVATLPELALTPWLLPEGALKVDLPTPLEPAPTPEVPAPFVSGVAYAGTADGREYLVASLAVHPAYKWEDIGRAMVDVEDDLGAQHGFAVTSRTAGAFEAMSSSRFTVVDARGPDESDADFETRKEGPATGEGVALVTGNHLYLVLVRGTGLAQAQFAPVLDSIVIA